MYSFFDIIADYEGLEYLPENQIKHGNTQIKLVFYVFYMIKTNNSIITKNERIPCMRPSQPFSRPPSKAVCHT